MKCELYHDNFQNFKRYNIPKAQLVIADIPYNIGADAFPANATIRETVNLHRTLSPTGCRCRSRRGRGRYER